MEAKLIGYDFWNKVLGSPRYIAAPMVDMSELAYRMLCRQYDAKVCYSPMLHSQQYLQDFLYRQDNFSTCAEDRPLIVQFCANDPSTFVNAALMLSSECDAVDLNLGCPQAIAKKGYYGSFLQDDWDVIRAIVQKASSDLPIPVTCKMRILPGHYKKSIEYAKMLEHSGCSVLTVHGRTREQNGHATGLASWEVIKEIKANVKIPIIANGNILSFTNVEDCLQYTGADAVMSAEALLHNPALFSSKNPPVWKVVEEYLQLAEKYNTSIRSVRCHLFKILYLCIYQDRDVQQRLTNGSTLTDFYSVVDLLKTLPERFAASNQLDTSEEQDSDNILSILGFEDTETASPDSKTIAYDNQSQISHFNPNDYTSFTVSEIRVNNLHLQNEENNNMEINRTVNKEKYETINYEKEGVNYLPVWLCHSRPRVAFNEKSRGCFSKYFDESLGTKSDEQHMSKKKLRRLKHHDRVLAGMKEKRKIKKLRHKQKVAEFKQNEALLLRETSEKTNNLTKKQKKMLIRERLLKAQGTSPKICINLGFNSVMETKELSKLSSQLRRLYGSNRHSEMPLHLYFCSFESSDELYKICERQNDGFSSYIVEMTADAPEDMFEVNEIIYLSPDSENVLETLDNNKVYVIGGIVDGTVKKDLSLNHAKNFNIQTARLPIAEYLVPFSTNPGTMVLTVNQVFDILLKFYETKDWTESLSINVPMRKGYCAPSKKNELLLSITPENNLSITKDESYSSLIS